MLEDEYRNYAVECLLLAREMGNSAHKAVLLAMADAWTALADQAAAASAAAELTKKPAREGEEPV
jgi:hypothetical protein